MVSRKAMVKNVDSIAVTVVMAAYREKEVHIRKTIESVLCQTMEDFKFIIILDDPENIALKEVIEEYALSDERISIYVNEKNLGPALSRNRGIMLADTKFIAIIDGDDVARPCRLEKQLHKIQEGLLDIVGGYVAVIDDSGQLLYNMNHLPLTNDKIRKKMRMNNCIPHSTCFLKREVYLALNGYTDMMCEDYDFLLRALQAGYIFGLVDDILVDYRLSEKSLSRNNLYRQYLMMQYLQDKYFVHKRNYQNYENIYKRKYTERRAEKYAKAAVYFEKALSYKMERKYLKMLLSICRGLISSEDYCVKILRYVMQNK